MLHNNLFFVTVENFPDLSSAVGVIYDDAEDAFDVVLTFGGRERPLAGTCPLALDGLIRWIAESYTDTFSQLQRGRPEYNAAAHAIADTGRAIYSWYKGLNDDDG